MTRTINSAVIGSLVREARTTAGLSQTELGHRIGASRFWVAQFEKGKPGAELGLAIKALEAVGLSVQIGPKAELKRTAGATRAPQPAGSRTSAPSELARVISRTTLATAVPSAIVGWPTASSPRGSRKR
jgi:HTH-type transcriptional regulator/antitoxin HipB